MTSRIKMVDLDDRLWESYWGQVYNRLERALGWILLSLGATIVLSYGVFFALRDFLSDSSVPILLRVGILTGLLGLVVLFLSVARQRWFAWKRDP